MLGIVKPCCSGFCNRVDVATIGAIGAIGATGAMGRMRPVVQQHLQSEGKRNRAAGAMGATGAIGAME